MITENQEKLHESTYRTKDEYRSFYGSFTIDDAIRHLGADYVEWLIKHENYHVEIKHRINGAWMQNNGASHKAYCAIMQAGQAQVERLLKHRLEANAAFDKAVETGRLSNNPKAENYAGNYMYMGNTKTDFGKKEDRDLFKHILTRKYIN